MSIKYVKGGVNMESSLPRMRVAKAAVAEIKALDPNTALSVRGLRSMIKEGRVPSVQVGKRQLINLDWLLERLANGDDLSFGAKQDDSYGILRVVNP